MEIEDQYNRGDEGRPKRRYLSTVALVGGVAGISWLLTGYGFDRFNKSQELKLPQGAQIDLTPVAQKPILVFSGQQEAKCPGDIEKVEIVRDGNKELRALNVICKPTAAEPAQ
jgi:hypothetical protein